AHWGFNREKPSLVVPGSGGVQRAIFRERRSEDAHAAKATGYSDLDEHSPVVINPRGLRTYVRNDVFFRSIPLVLAVRPDVKFVCPSMRGDPVATAWVARLGVAKATLLMPLVGCQEMSALLRRAVISVSPSTHDGTPNTLLEAMACGCFPVAGDIPSIREWIRHGVNGLLCDPTSPDSVAREILCALGNKGLRERARAMNRGLVDRLADYDRVMPRVESFYSDLVSNRHICASQDKRQKGNAQ